MSRSQRLILPLSNPHDSTLTDPASTGEGETGLYTGASWQWGEYPLTHMVGTPHSQWTLLLVVLWICVSAISSKELVSGATVGQGHLQNSSAL